MDNPWINYTVQDISEIWELDIGGEGTAYGLMLLVMRWLMYWQRRQARLSELP